MRVVFAQAQFMAINTCACAGGITGGGTGGCNGGGTGGEARGT